MLQGSQELSFSSFTVAFSLNANFLSVSFREAHWPMTEILPSSFLSWRVKLKTVSQEYPINWCKFPNLRALNYDQLWICDEPPQCLDFLEDFFNSIFISTSFNINNKKYDYKAPLLHSFFSGLFASWNLSKSQRSGDRRCFKSELLWQLWSLWVNYS